MTKISEIILVYNAASYIERCARSLMEQTFQDVEYIFVNDCTPDNSINILNNIIHEYPNRYSQVKIINHPSNKGIANARNTGLDNAIGDYIIFTDSDDWIEPDMLSTMFKKAIDGHYDIVWCAVKSDEGVFPKPKKDYISSLLKREVCLGPYDILVKKSLYDKVRYIPNQNCGEDLNVKVKLHYYADNICFIDRTFYHWTINENSLTHTERNLEKNGSSLVNNVIDIDLFLKDKGLSEKYAKELLFCKVHSKEYLLNICDNKSLDKWCTIFPETNTHVFSLPYPIYTKIEFWAIVHGCYWPFKLSRWFHSVLS